MDKEKRVSINRSGEQYPVYHYLLIKYNYFKETDHDELFKNAS